MNMYAYVGGDPVNATDPTGSVAETVWDAANVGLGAWSLADNLESGNYGWAVLDAAGLVYDGIATAVPFLPAGASASLQAYRTGNSILDSLKVGSDVANVASSTHQLAKVLPPSLTPVGAGQKLHLDLGSAVDGKLSDGAMNFLAGANGHTGRQPDLRWSNAPGVWADVTTAGQWGKHVSAYGAKFGEGIPIIYGRGEGVVNSAPIVAGGGAAAYGAEAAACSSLLGCE
jgi:hypothetical protein